MKLRYGKEEWLDLEHLPLESRRVGGMKIFEPKYARSAHAAVLANAVVARTFGKHGRTKEERRALNADKVEVATFRDDAGKLRVVYREAVVQFKPDVPPARRDALLRKFGLEVRSRDAHDPDQVVVVDPRRRHVAEGMVELCNRLCETDEVAFAFPNFVSHVRRMGRPPAYAEQWHLDVIEARRAWRVTRGEGITIAILDDGVDVEHPNLRKNIKRRPDPSDRRDLCGRDFFVDGDTDPPEHFDPRPKCFHYPFWDYNINDIHGTCCAGVAAASGDMANVRGSAPRARILPVKIYQSDAPVTELHIARALHYAARCADVISASWDAPHNPAIDAALHGAARGRRGRGVPLFFAAGNETGAINYPARSPHAIAVGASTYQDKKAHYSNIGKQLSVVAPSGVSIVRPFLDPRPGYIYTTDLSYLRRGFNTGIVNAGGVDGLHYNKFSGTSSSAPLTAGVAALMLAANPKLTRDEVRDVLQSTADKIGGRGSYKTNGHSTNYGFGRVNAAKAVAEAVRLRRRH